MILQSLADFSMREGLVQDSAFEYAGVSWAIEVGPDGSFWELMPLRVEAGGKGKKLIPRQMLVPKRSKRTVQELEEFLVDKAEYVLGAGEADPGRLERRRNLFAKAIGQAAAATQVPELRAVAQFLANDAARLQCLAQLNAHGFASNDLFCFRVDDRFLHDIEAVRAYWKRKLIPGNATAEVSGTQCLICGKVGSFARLHPNVKGLAGASTSGVPVVSFNQPAFWSYGWENNKNAAVCEDCAAAYATALNRCLSSQFPDPAEPESKLTRQAYVLAKNLTAIYWSDDSSSGIESLAEAAVSDPGRVQTILESPWKGAATAKPLRFHCLLLQGAQGRATVRSYSAELIPKVQQNVRKWFEHTAARTDRALSLPQILSALAVRRKYMKLPPDISRELYLAVLFGLPIPRQLVQLAVRRNLAEAAVADGRAAIIQAWLSRKLEQEGRNPIVKLDPNYDSVGYQLGRVLAVCEQIQYRATDGGKVNKSLTDRFFPALSTRPSFVFQALIKLTKSRLAQIRRRKDSTYLERSLQEVVANLGPDDLTGNLSLDEQARFALGYYHERQARFAKSETQPTAPEENTADEV